MSSGRENELSGGLERSIENLRKHGLGAQGNVELSLQLQLLSDLGIINERLANAERQRFELGKKLEKVSEEQGQVRTNTETLKALTDAVERLANAETLNTEFRLKFMGGSGVAKIIWVVMGGFAVWFFENYIMRR